MPEYQVCPDTHFHPHLDDYKFMCGDKRNSKKQEIWQLVSRTWKGAMKNADTEGFAFRGDIRRDMQDLPKFSLGQSVLLYWAGSMHSAKEPPLSMGGKKGMKRPAWFMSEIYGPPEKLPSGAKYGGYPMSGWGYKVF